ncbi:MAG TPA: hypothetical protein VK097_06320 [Lentibacillus sp.]|uniref:hypothetical protein n=1 Tax=Lentibacillus sp. TaxID=1925746 RepID=UPI002B4B448C|nr:hypothetical protein [Lentibacillus sp.]HLR62037.1 hypothetical protein [Lentibacillus sp.]
MKKNRHLNKLVLIGSIFVLLIGSFLMPVAAINVHADEEGDDEAPNHSGGFMIETERVEGSMDLLGALQGKISIKQGKIEGLRITKTLEENEKPFAIKIKSDGPIPVQNLEARTVDGKMPHIGGFCGINLSTLLEKEDIEKLLAHLSTLDEDQIVAMIENLNLDGLLEKVDLEQLVQKLKTIDPENPDFGGIFDGIDPTVVISDINTEALRPILETVGLSKVYVSICLKNVSMKVTEQSVEDISLPEAEIETCYKSECNQLPDAPQTNTSGEKSGSAEEMKSILKQMEEQEKQINTAKKGMEEDNKKLNDIKDSISQTNDTDEKLQGNNMLDESLSKLKQFFGDKIKDQEMLQFVTEKLNLNEADEEQNIGKSLVSLTGKIAEDYNTFDDIHTELKKTLDKTQSQFNELEESVQSKAEKLSSIEGNMEEQSAAHQQLRKNIQFIRELSGDHGKSGQGGNESDLTTVKKDIKKLKEEIKAVKGSLGTLQEKADAVNGQLETWTKRITEIKSSFEGLKDDYPNEVYKTVMENLSVDQDEDSNDNGSQEDETRQTEKDQEGSGENSAENSKDGNKAEKENKSGETTGKSEKSEKDNKSEEKSSSKKTNNDKSADNKSSNEEKDTKQKKQTNSKEKDSQNKKQTNSINTQAKDTSSGTDNKNSTDNNKDETLGDGSGRDGLPDLKELREQSLIGDLVSGLTE